MHRDEGTLFFLRCQAVTVLAVLFGVAGVVLVIVGMVVVEILWCRQLNSFFLFRLLLLCFFDQFLYAG